MNYNDVIVKKPWGHEYLVYENENLGIWFLHIEKDQKTSLHCHPKKNTGLVVLDGHAEVSFLKNKIELKGVDKIMIFRGRFHSTKALSEKGVFVLEVEAPQDKHDLVRLEDKYGRENKPYEGKEKEIEKTDDCLWIQDSKLNESISYNFSNCKIKIESITAKEQLFNRPYEEVLVFLRGAIVSKSNDKIVQPGDVIAGHSLDRILNAFDITEEVSVLSINRDKNA